MPANSNILRTAARLSFPRVTRDIWRAFLQRRQNQRQAKALAYLDRYLLRDIGITQVDASREIARLGWQAPDHWRE